VGTVHYHRGDPGRCGERYGPNAHRTYLVTPNFPKWLMLENKIDIHFIAFHERIEVLDHSHLV
jgi:hypothetical protein